MLLFLLIPIFFLSRRLCRATSPNIVLVVVDDLGWNDHNLYNSDAKIKTNDLQNIAEEGILLTNYRTQPVCSPTRTSLMTGLYPFRVGMQHSETVKPGSTAHIPLEIPILPEILKENGYYTQMIGKWHLGYSSFNYTPYYRGFDDFSGFFQGQEDYTNKVVSNDGYFSLGYDFWHNDTVDWSANTTHSTKLYKSKLKKSIPILKQNQPFFLYYSLQGVHVPLQPSRQYFSCMNISSNKYKIDYCNLVFDIQSQIDELVTELKKNDVYENTLLIVTSDNGGMVPFATDGEIPLWPASYGENYPYRGSKTTLFEGGIRATAFLAGGYIPKNIPDYDGLIHAVDIHKIILEASESQAKNSIDGLNLWSDILQKDCIIRREELPINIINKGVSFSGIIYQNFKLIIGLPYIFPESDGWWGGEDEYHLPPEHSEDFYLFDLNLDPYEHSELDISENRGIITKLRKKIYAYTKGEYVEAQQNIVNPKSLPSNFAGVWYPFENNIKK